MSATTDVGAGYPVLDVDPFSDEFLLDPYPFHEQLREAGPVVRIERYALWTMARHEQVQATLSDWKRFSSARGVGLTDYAKEPPFRKPSIILEADPPEHTKARAVLNRIVGPRSIRKIRDTFEAEAERIVDDVVTRGSFDAIKDLAEVYPVKVFPDAVGIPAEGRENLLPYGSLVFNSFGPRNRVFEEAMVNADAVIEWITRQVARDALAPDGMGAQIYAAADAGELTMEEAGLLVRSFLSAGVDTTVNGLGNAIYCFARHPEQWRLLRDDPSLMQPAFDEVLRYESPVQTFFRTTTEEVDVDGVRIGEGEKVLLFLGAANRDPRRWEDPDRFDVLRKPSGHVAFGTGVHGCVGQHVARLEAELVLTAFARRVESFEITGEPQRRLNNTLRALGSLPVTVRRA